MINYINIKVIRIFLKKITKKNQQKQIIMCIEIEFLRKVYFFTITTSMDNSNLYFHLRHQEYPIKYNLFLTPKIYFCVKIRGHPKNMNNTN